MQSLKADNTKLDVKYRAFYLSLEVIKFLDSLDKKNSLRVISDQLVRAVTSIGANIVEAKSSSSKKEFINYFQISLKSANETKYWLALLKELVTDKPKMEGIIKETDEISKIIGSSILTMKGKKSF